MVYQTCISLYKLKRQKIRFLKVFGKIYRVLPEAQRQSVCAQLHFEEGIWRPSRCQNELHDSSLEILTCLISKYTIFFLFGVDFPSQNLIFPRLVKKGTE